MDANRKLIAQCLGVLLALPILYAVSSGPVIRYASIDPHRAVKVEARPASSYAVRRTLAAQDYFTKVETYPVDTGPARADYAQTFYRPLVQAANALHLETPLSAYLHVWGVFTIGTKNGHFFFLVLNKR